MGTRIVRGRPFTATDREDAPLVAIVSESMGKVLWPGADPIGQCIRVGFLVAADTRPCSTVIGIAEDVVQQSLSEPQRLLYYLPLDQVQPAGGNQIALRMSGRNASSSIERVRRELQKVMPGQGYVTVLTLEELVDTQRRSWALGATMFVAFGVLALLVAAVGLYGVIAYNVAQRLHELGVRIALGARSRDVIRLVVGQGLAFGVAGVAIGLVLALVASRWIQPLLFEQSARDPVTYGGVGAVIILVALLASALPAVRAARADPNTVLRSD
jgi:ABC-type antimicrobial peptide transport system permease subunit